MVERLKGTPAASVAVTPTVSPSACIIRANTVGAIPNGSADL